MLLRNKLNPTIGSINHAIRACIKTQNWEKLSVIIEKIDVYSDCYIGDKDSIEKQLIPRIKSTFQQPTGLKTMSECIKQLKVYVCSDDVGAAITKVSEYSEGSIALALELKELLIKINNNNKYCVLVDNAKLRRRVNRLINCLDNMKDVAVINEKIEPNLNVYKSLIESAGLKRDSKLAFHYFNDAIKKNIEVDRGLYRILIEACTQAGDLTLTEQARQLLINKYGLLNTIAKPEAIFSILNKQIIISNGLGKLFSTISRKLVNLIESQSKYNINHNALLEKGIHISLPIGREMLTNHCEKQALAVFYEYDLKMNKTSDWFMEVNLCMCLYCHEFFSHASQQINN